MRKCFVNFAFLLFALSVSTVVAEGSGPQAQVLYSFAGKSDGIGPQAALLADSKGNLYGTTAYGGESKCLTVVYGCGTVFELSPNSGGWDEAVLYRFSGRSDGALPTGKLIADGNGNLYGTTGRGGDLGNDACNAGGVNIGCGVVFELSPPTAPRGGWTETVLYTFAGTGGSAYPTAGLIFDADGNLYGTASGGGSTLDEGVAFELSPPAKQGDPWSFVTLYSFQGLNDGGLPLSDLVFDSIGNLYGTACFGGTGNGGVVFELAPPGQQGGAWTESVIADFGLNSCPRAGVVFDSSGNLYGTTSGGYGSVFELIPVGSEWTENVIYQFSKNSSKIPWASPILDQFGNVYGTDLGEVCGSVYRLKAVSWLESEYDFFDNHGDPCFMQGALIFGKNATVYGTSTDGGAFKKGTVFAIH